MRTLFLNFLTVGLAVSCLIALAAALAPLLRKYYRARLRKLVWLVLAVRLLLPWSVPLPQAQQPVVTLTVPAAAAQPVVLSEPLPAGAPQASGVNSAAGQDRPANSLPAPLDIAAALWLGGALLFLLAPLARYGLWRRGLRRWDRPLSPAAGAAYERACRRAAVRRVPRAFENDAVDTPMLTGLARPVLLVPPQLAQSPALEEMLLHELMHARHGDVGYKLVLLAARAVHWYNPLVWLLVRKAGQDVEFACDEAVLQLPGAPAPQAYGGALLAAVPPQRPAALSAQFSGGKAALQRRFAAIFDKRPKRGGKPVLAAVLLVAALCASLAACEVAAQPVKEAVSEAAQSAAPAAKTAALPAAVTDMTDVPRSYRLFASGSASGLGKYGLVLEERLTVPNRGGMQYSANGSGCWLPEEDVALLGGLAEDGALVLQRSADHGATWQRKEVPGDFGLPFAIDVVGPGRCVLLTYEDGQQGARVYQCKLDGEGFPVLEGARNYALPIPKNATVGRGLFLNEKIGFVSYAPAGQLSTKPYILVTTDGGVHWRKEDFADGLAGSPFGKYRACCIFWNGAQVEVRCFTEEEPYRENLSLISEDFGQSWTWRRRMWDADGSIYWEGYGEEAQTSPAIAMQNYLNAQNTPWSTAKWIDAALLPSAENSLSQQQYAAWEAALAQGAELGWMEFNPSLNAYSQQFALLEKQEGEWVVTDVSRRAAVDETLRAWNWPLRDGDQKLQQQKDEAQAQIDAYLRENGEPRTPEERARLQELRDKYDAASREWDEWTAQRPSAP